MAMFPLDRIRSYLNKRRGEHLERRLTLRDDLIDLSSNDYLGLSRSAYIHQEVISDLKSGNFMKGSATGSRLLNGNSALAERLESFLADFHHGEAALLFNSGYDANAGLLATVARPGDVIYYDELAHASIHQGLKLSGATCIAFNHNDTAHLQSLLQERPGFIVTESLFSMEGDMAPLRELADIARSNGMALIVDEAHANGIYGRQGSGLCEVAGVEADCFARVYTFGKALGSHGAVVVGSADLKQYLVNFCKPFIYSTAQDTAVLLRVEHAYKFIQNDKIQLNKLLKLNNYFKNMFSSAFPGLELRGTGPVYGLIWSGNASCRALAAYLQQNGLDIRPIVSPTVPEGSERLRISLHSFNTEKEIDLLIRLLQQYSA